MAKGAEIAPVNAAPASAAAPIVLYESVCAALPLKVVPEAAPEPELFMVRALVVTDVAQLPLTQSMFAMPSVLMNAPAELAVPCGMTTDLPPQVFAPAELA